MAASSSVAASLTSLVESMLEVGLAMPSVLNNHSFGHQSTNCRVVSGMSGSKWEKGLEILIAVVFCKECVLPVQ